jgi:hypothetical protein
MKMHSRFKIAAILAALPALACAAAPAGRADVSPPPPCTDNSAACLEKVARMYVDALISHDGSQLPLAPNIRRTENALTNAEGAYAVRESFARTHMVEKVRDADFFVDTAKGEVLGFFVLDVDLKAADAEATTKAGDKEYKVAVTVPEGTYTVHEAERFKIVKGMITEIEIIAHVEKGKGAGSGWPVSRNKEVEAPAGK